MSTKILDTDLEFSKIRSFLKENDYYDWEEMDQIDDDKIAISVSWGDWKHSHLRLDYLMKQLGYILIKEEETEENGDDCYSSIHYYTKLAL